MTLGLVDRRPRVSETRFWNCIHVAARTSLNRDGPLSAARSLAPCDQENMPCHWLMNSGARNHSEISGNSITFRESFYPLTLHQLQAV